MHTKAGAIFVVVRIFLSTVLGSNAVLASKAPPSLSPANEASLQRQYEIISSELVETSDGKYHQSASPQCWKDVISSLEASSTHIMSYDPNDAISPATHFCAGMNQLQRETLAIGLTACHVNRSTQFIPDNCLTMEVASGLNETAVRACLSDLRESNDYMVYTQFFLYTEQACTNLTMELSIRRKNEAIWKLEQNALEMKEFQSGLAEFQSKQENVMKNIKKVAEESEERQNIIMAKMTRQGDASLELLQENKLAMLALQQSTRSNEEKIILEMKEMYGESGLEEIKKIIHKFKHHRASTIGWNLSSGWNLLFKYGRFLTIFVGLLSTFSSRRFHPTRFYIILLSILEFGLEHVLSIMVESGQLEPSRHDFCIAFLRRYDVPVYMILLVLTYIFSFVFGYETRNKSKTVATVNDGNEAHQSTESVHNTQINTATLEMIQNELRLDREAHRKAQERVNNELLLLRRHITNQNTSNGPIQPYQYTTPLLPRPSSYLNLPPRHAPSYAPFGSPPPLYYGAETSNHPATHHTPSTNNDTSYQTPTSEFPLTPPTSTPLPAPGAPLRAPTRSVIGQYPHTLGNINQVGAAVNDAIVNVNESFFTPLTPTPTTSPRPVPGAPMRAPATRSVIGNTDEQFSDILGNINEVGAAVDESFSTPLTSSPLAESPRERKRRRDESDSSESFEDSFEGISDSKKQKLSK